MSKSKTRKAKPINGWLSARIDCKEERFLQLGTTFLHNEKVKQLSAGALHLYLCTAMNAGPSREFVFPQHAAKAYGIAPSSFRRYIRELVEAGFIRKRYSGKLTREANGYEFSFEWKGIKDVRPPHVPPMS